MVKLLLRLWEEKRNDILYILRLCSIAMAILCGFYSFSFAARWHDGTPLAEVFGLCMTWGDLAGLGGEWRCFRLSRNREIAMVAAYSGLLSMAMFLIIGFENVLLRPFHKSREEDG